MTPPRASCGALYAPPSSALPRPHDPRHPTGPAHPPSPPRFPFTPARPAAEYPCTMGPRASAHAANGKHATDHVQVCIDACLRGQRESIMTLTYLRDMGGAHIDPVRVRSLLDCADVCQFAATFMMRGSHRHVEMCAVAARICRDCAESCDGTNDQQLRKVVEACRGCEAVCRELINAHSERAPAQAA